jgi:hypothetical protein
MKNERTIKIIAVGATTLLFISFLWTGYSIKLNKQMDADLNNERLRGEKILSEKLDLDKQIRDFKNDILSLKGKNTDLDKFLNEANEKISAKEILINRLTRENKAMVDLRKENESIRKMRDELNWLVQDMTATNTDLTNEIGTLKERITTLMRENENLSTKLQENEVNRLVDNVAGNVRIETLKKRNQKLTVKSSRTNSVSVSFNMPEEYSGKVNTGFFRIILQNPEGGSIEGKQVTTFNTETLKLNASTENTIPPVSRERVSINFNPDNKLKGGIYTIIVYEGNHILGTAQVRLAR